MARGRAGAHARPRAPKHVCQDCLSTGAPLLVDWRSGDLDPVLDPVMDRRYVRRGAGLVVVLGDKEVDVAPGFALFICTTASAPALAPELCAKVCAVDFTVTQAGLEDQLLGRLVMTVGGCRGGGGAGIAASRRGGGQAGRRAGGPALPGIHQPHTTPSPPSYPTPEPCRSDGSWRSGASPWWPRSRRTAAASHSSRPTCWPACPRPRATCSTTPP